MNKMFTDGIDYVEAYNHIQGNSNLELTYCGYEKCEPGFIMPSHIRDCHLIHYVIKGNGRLEQNHKTYNVGPGEIFTIYPGRVVSYYAPDPKDPWTFCWFGFTGGLVPELLNNAGISPDKPVCSLHSESEEEFLSIIKVCADMLQSGEYISNTLIKSYLYRLFYILESSYTTGSSQLNRPGRATQLLKGAITFIEYNYMKDISIRDISQYLKIDRKYCWKIFQQYTGKSPQQYLIHYRIEKAVELMQNNYLRVNEAAACVGIPDQYYFSRLFKKLKGVAPSSYVRRMLI